MIKQPTQLLRFFSSYLEVEKDWEKRNAGNPGSHIITEDMLFIPPFQIKFDNEGIDYNDFTTHEIDLINYNDGTITDLTNIIISAGVFTYGDYQNFVYCRFPLLWDNLVEGDFYLKLWDGPEYWYSEVFKLCNLNRNLLREYSFYSWYDSAEYDVLSTQDFWGIDVCKQAAGDPYVYSSSFQVVKDEPLDFYCWGEMGGVVCTPSTFLPLYWVLCDMGGNVISDVHTGIDGCNQRRFVPTKTCEAQLKGYTANADTGNSAWGTYLFYANPMQETSDETDNIGKRKVLRWSHSCNICGMIYEEISGYIGQYFYWILSYENFLILDDPPLIPEFEIKENVSENDKGDKIFLQGAQLDWYYFQIGARENLAKAIYNIHLHSTVEIDYNGEKHVICENASEISYANDYNSTVKFRFREESCSVDSCCFDLTCCPNLENVLDVLANDIDLPLCEEATNGDRYLVNKGALGTYYIYECDGSNWSYYPSLNAPGNCIIDEDAIADGDQTPYLYYNGDHDNWYRFVHILSVTNNTDGTATVNLRNYSKPGLVVIVQVDGVDTGSIVVLYGTAAETITVTTGAGTFEFNIRIIDNNCDYGISNVVEKAITDV